MANPTPPGNQQPTQEQFFAQLQQKSEALGMQADWAAFQKQMQQLQQQFAGQGQALNAQATLVKGKAEKAKTAVIATTGLAAIAAGAGTFFLGVKNRDWRKSYKALTVIGATILGAVAGVLGSGLFTKGVDKDIQNLQQNGAMLGEQYNAALSGLVQNYAQELQKREGQQQQAATQETAPAPVNEQAPAPAVPSVPDTAASEPVSQAPATSMTRFAPPPRPEASFAANVAAQRDNQAATPPLP